MVRNNTLSPLRTARLLAGVRQVELASAVDRSTMYISRLERGESARLTGEIAEKLAAAVDVPAVILFMGSKK
jgi:transcriptional regulator with XRE-family HTH domain